MPIKFDLKKLNANSIFIETGTYMGQGVIKALTSGYKEVHSIELDTKRYESNVKRFKNKKNVHLYHGNSGIVLHNIMKKIKEPCVFWLDAHYCGDGAEMAEKWCPLKEELQAILNHDIKTHTILVDDMRCMDLQHIDVKTQKPVDFPGTKNLIIKIKEINPEYKITYLNGHIKNDVLCAKI